VTKSRQSFETLWQQIQRDISVGETIENWTQFSGDIGNSFTIRAVNARFIEVDSPNAKYFQRVPRKDFAAIYELWDAYIAGRVQRRKTTELTRYSKYIISILHYVIGN